MDEMKIVVVVVVVVCSSMVSVQNTGFSYV